MNRRNKMAIILTVVATALSAVGTSVLWLPSALAQAPEGAAATDPDVLRWGLMAAAVATGASSLGAGYAVGTVGAAAVGALTEKPELLGRMLILVGLAEGIAIYGLLISILIFNRLA
jgi:V/A-type H+-transporting ATPase subunit K